MDDMENLDIGKDKYLLGSLHVLRSQAPFRGPSCLPFFSKSGILLHLLFLRYLSRVC